MNTTVIIELNGFLNIDISKDNNLHHQGINTCIYISKRKIQTCLFERESKQAQNCIQNKISLWNFKNKQTKEPIFETAESELRSP